MSFFKTIFALFNRPLHKLAYFLSGVIPRNKCIWLVGAQKKSFACNPKHLYLQMHQELPEGVRCYWVTRDKSLAARLAELGFPAVYAGSMKGIWLCLRAGVYFVNCDIKDVSFYLSRKALVFNLWHGIPLKKIQFDNPKNERNVLKLSLADASIIRRIAYPFESIRYWRVLSTSKFVTDYSFASAFGVDKDQCLTFGYPRTDVFFIAQDACVTQMESVGDEYSKATVAWLKGFNKSYVYMPTWRDTGNDFIVESGVDFVELQRFLQARNECFLIKLHPYTKIGSLDLAECPNIKLIDRSADIYPLLSFIDVLVTDYSSIYFDYLLLDRPVIFFAFDYENYLENCRDMYLDYEQYTPGPRAYSFAQLIDTMAQQDQFRNQRREMRELFWGDYQGGASRAIIEYVYQQVVQDKQ